MRARYGARNRASRRSEFFRDATSGDFRDFHEAVVEGRAAAEVGGALRGDVVGIAPVGRMLLPPHRRRHDDTGARLAVDTGAQHIAAAIVEDANLVAVANAAAR